MNVDKQTADIVNNNKPAEEKEKPTEEEINKKVDEIFNEDDSDGEKDEKKPDGQSETDKGDQGKKESSSTILKSAGLDENQKLDDGENDKKQEEPDKKTLFQVMKEYKKENKELKALIKDEIIPFIKSVKENGGVMPTKSEIDEISEKYNVDKDFLTDVIKVAKKQAEDEISAKHIKADDDEEKKPQLSREEVLQKIDSAIDTEFNKAITSIPEFKKVADIKVVKAFIMANPKVQAVRPMDDILYEIYGKFVKPGSGFNNYSAGAKNYSKEMDYSNLSDEDHVELAKDREAGGEKYQSYADDLISRMTGITSRKK